MMGLHFMKEVPFRTVYIHALVRDAKGQKMSKSRGNVIDPLEIGEKYGTDALRFTLAALAAQGSDINLAESRIEGYRNFVTKLWNAARYCQMNGCKPRPEFDPSSANLTVNRWITGKMAQASAEVTAALEAYRFNEAANAAYHFTWGTFCDWYLEFTKPILESGNEAEAAETRATTAWVLDRILVLLHPFMPFVTEELWGLLGDARDIGLMETPWLDSAETVDAEAEAEMDWVVRLVSLVRSIRAEMGIAPGVKIPLGLAHAGAAARRRLETHRDLLVRLARLESATALEGEAPRGAVQDVLDDATIVLPIAGIVDVAGETARLNKEIAKLDVEIGKLEKKLANPGFLGKAPPDVVEEQRRRLDDAVATPGQARSSRETAGGGGVTARDGPV